MGDKISNTSEWVVGGNHDWGGKKNKIKKICLLFTKIHKIFNKITNW